VSRRTVKGITLSAPASPIKDNVGRVERVLGAIYPTYSSRFFPVLYQNVRTHRLPSGFRSVEEMLYREDRRCVTENYDVRTILLLLREEGIIEYGKTPLCGNGDVSSFLRRLVESSGLPYRDTMLALLDDQSGSDNSLVIEDDPEETRRETGPRDSPFIPTYSRRDLRIRRRDINVGA
jgi:hypothetical protein